MQHLFNFSRLKNVFYYNDVIVTSPLVIQLWEVGNSRFWNSILSGKIINTYLGKESQKIWNRDLSINKKNSNDVTICQHYLISNFFWLCLLSLVKFSYWFRFLVKIITGSWVMTIFFYKGLTRNEEMRNTPVWVFPNIWRLGWVGDAKFGANHCSKNEVFH